MRAISLVKKIEFEYSGNVSRNALTLGDLDNDGCNELIVGNDQGEIVIFKGREKLQTISNLNFIACVAVGDVRNRGANSLVVVTSNGWCYIYEDFSSTEREADETDHDVDNVDEIDGQARSSSNDPASETQSSGSTYAHENSRRKKDIKRGLICVHEQRIPANVKNILLGDVDADGQIEMVLGLTDRVVRSYRFMKHVDSGTKGHEVDEDIVSSSKVTGKLIAINKWECANQIGSISLHDSKDGTPSILVAQPGGTFMRIKCYLEGHAQDRLSSSISSNSEHFHGSVDYQFLGISRMRNQNISTEIIGDLRCLETSESGQSQNTHKSRPYAIATLDGSIMLVQDEVILWAIAVDHQIFALTKLDVRGNGSDDIVVCAWDGQTYILDQNKNSVRFHLEEPVRAFHSGWYNLEADQPAVTALVYVTFKNSIVVYYDIPLRDLICKKFDPDTSRLSELFKDKNRTSEASIQHVETMKKKTKRELVEYLLYDFKS